MLYNPEWKKPEVREVSAADFIAWLESHDPTETYYFQDNHGRCLMGQYMTQHHIPWGMGNYRPTMAKVFSTQSTNSLDYHFGRGPEYTVLAARPQTFGAALKRTKKYLNIN